MPPETNRTAVNSFQPIPALEANMAINILNERIDGSVSTEFPPSNAARIHSRQTPCVVWLTGPNGAGKSAIASLVARHLGALGCHAMLLDGADASVSGLAEPGACALPPGDGVGRVGEMAKLLHDAGLIVIVAHASPLRADRARVAAHLPPGRFVEVFVDAPTLADEAYEAPLSPALSLRADRTTPEQAAEHIVQATIGREWRP